MEVLFILVFDKDKVVFGEAEAEEIDEDSEDSDEPDNDET
jgi:hypothetical protein